jgi:hypothetical protein
MSVRSRARFLCETRAARYADEAAAHGDVAKMERKKNLNPDVLRPFKCDHCGYWHIGTWITKLTRNRRDAPR